MQSLLFKLRALAGDRRGVSAVEYAVLIGVVGVAVVGAINAFDIQDFIGNLFGQLTAMENIPASGGGGSGGGD